MKPIFLGKIYIKVYNEFGSDVEDGRGVVALGQIGQRWTDSTVRQLQRICFVTPESIFPYSQPPSYDSSLSRRVSTELLENIMIDSYGCYIFLAGKKNKQREETPSPLT